MRRNAIMLLAAALMVVTGCKKDNNNAVDGEKMVFNAGFGNGGAKTEINGFDMNWTKGDVVVINGGDFAADSDGASTKLIGDSVEKEGDLYKAYYPKAICNEGNLTLPATQTYNGTKLTSVNPMYAQSESTTLEFHNICALVRVDLKGSGSVKSIEVKANEPLSGAFNIAEEGGKYYAQLTSKEVATVTLDCGAGVALSGTAQPFYVALPQGTYTNLTFTVNDTKVVKTVDEKALEAGKLYTLAAEYEGDPVFSVSPTQKVYFTPANLQYIGSAETPYFKFADHQWEYIGGTYNHGQFTTDVDANRDLFGWGTSGYNGVQPYTTAGPEQEGNNYPAGDIAGTDYDWGQYNDIYNPSSGKIDPKGTWRTPTASEWHYLLYTRRITVGDVAKKTYFLCTVNGSSGMVILPDNWDGSLFQGTMFANAYGVVGKVEDYIFNETSKPKWSEMEAAGVAFLPAAGGRSLNESSTEPYIKPSNVGTRGGYYASTAEDIISQDLVHTFDKPANASWFKVNEGGDRKMTKYPTAVGCSVRMVRNAN